MLDLRTSDPNLAGSKTFYCVYFLSLCVFLTYLTIIDGDQYILNPLKILFLTLAEHCQRSDPDSVGALLKAGPDFQHFA
jgi:hypothetical protein